MRDDLVGRGRAPLGQVLGRVRVADEGGVVAADERAVEGRADALVGLRADDDEPADAEVREQRLERRLVERVGVGLRRRAARRRPGSARGRSATSSLPGARCSLECWTHTTGTSACRARSTSVETFATTVSRSCVPPTTPFCTSITRSAVSGRFSSVAMAPMLTTARRRVQPGCRRPTAARGAARPAARARRGARPSARRSRSSTRSPRPSARASACSGSPGPARRPSTSPASARTPRCFATAWRVMPSGTASSVAVALPRVAISSRTVRRVGSARALKTSGSVTRRPGRTGRPGPRSPSRACRPARRRAAARRASRVVVLVEPEHEPLGRLGLLDERLAVLAEPFGEQLGVGQGLPDLVGIDRRS